MTNDLPMRTLRLIHKEVEAEGIFSFHLAAADGTELPEFTAGAHVMVHLSNGIVRPYSLCNDPAARGSFVIAVLAEPNSRGGSAAMHELEEGATVQITGPRNHFQLVEEASKHILFAGGIGITPLLAMAWRLWAKSADFEFHVCARTRAKAAFVDQLLAAPFAGCVKLHFDDGPQDQRLDTQLLQQAAGAESHLYVCGPQGFMDHILTSARANGWKESQLHFESFTADLSVHAGDLPFEVEITSTGHILQIRPGESIVHVLSDHGIDLPISCEMGVCGTCVTRVLKGIPDHRDMYLTPEEQGRNDQFTPCCSRSKSARLVLDL